MDKSSLLHFLLKEFGTQVAVLLLVLSSAMYGPFSATAKQDFFLVSSLQDTAHRLEQAAHSSLRFLKSKNSADLDVYNSQILAVGKTYAELAPHFKDAPNLQKKFLEVQKKSRAFFLATNERLETGLRSGAAGGERALASSAEADEAVSLLEALSRDIRETSSRPLQIGTWTLPAEGVFFWVGILFSSLLVLASQRLQKADLRAKKRDLSEMKIQSILLDGILNSISEALIVIDERGRFTRYNTAAQRIIGSQLKSISSEEDAREFGFFDIETLQALGLQEMPFTRALRGEAVDDLEMLVHNETHPEGIYISVSSRYLNDIDGSIRGALVVFRDISKRKATELEWQRARESALETARKKSDFLAAMSHEIRTPMNGVIGMTTLLAETPLSAEQRDYVGTIQRSAEALLRLINDILDHSKIEAGKVQIHPRPFDLKFLFEDVVELFNPTVREKNLALDLSWSGRGVWFFMGDPERLRQILVNLLGNAVKFTEKGRVQVKVESEGAPGDGGLIPLKVSVCDTGAGLSEEECQLLFQKYVQTKSGMKYGGTGLGLSICRQLVELMGGAIGVESKPGLGSTFWFTLKLPVSQPEDIAAKKEPSFAALFTGRVLLAEDQPVNQRVAVAYLEKLGLSVEVAANGQNAVEKALKNPYDLILMDCQMPVMTGYEATQRIRQGQSGAARTPVVALTAEGTSGERATCFSVGMDDFLTKPLELEHLVAVLRRWLPGSSPALDVSALEKLKTYVVNNKSLTQALIEDYQKSAPGLLAELREAWQQGRLDEARAAAHALKSTSATLGASSVAALCQQVEDLEQAEGFAELVAKLEKQLEQSQRELQKYLTKAAA